MWTKGFCVNYNDPDFGNGMRAEIGHADVLESIHRFFEENEGDADTQLLIISIGRDILNCTQEVLLKAIGAKGDCLDE